MDAVRFEKSSGYYSVWDDDPFPTGAIQPPGSATGWSSFGFENALGSSSYDAGAGAYRGNIIAAADRWRASGVIASPAEWMPYSVVGAANYVRAKFYVYAGGQSNQSDLNQIPNMRLRVQNRFAVNSMLEVFNHINGDPEQAPMRASCAPTRTPQSPRSTAWISIPWMCPTSHRTRTPRGSSARSSLSAPTPRITASSP